MMEREAIYRRFHPKVMTYVRNRVDPMDAEDVAADVFVKVYGNLPRFDSQKGSLSTWIYSITRNTVIDYWKCRNHASLSLEEHPEHLTEEEALGMDGKLDALSEALSELSPVQRDVVILHYCFGLKHTEIGAKMGLSPVNTRKICSLALSSLRNNLRI